ncbi:hypothetical protein SLA2020_176880 [Shorea laevis]
MPSFVIEETKKLWATWNIRVFIIVSLLVQVFLILFAPYRKRRSKKYGKCVDLLIWSIYLLADWVASFSIGLIVSKQIKGPIESNDIQVFWAPFLLLHLGGPDTITSFALEDNEFWVRHLLGLLLQVGSTAYVFIKSLPENKLWLPTILVLVAGIIKYAERNHAFYLASFDHLGDGWVPSEWGDELPVPVVFQEMDVKTVEKFENNLKSILWTAVHHLGTIKMTLVGPFLSPEQCSDIRETFLQLGNSFDVLRVMEIELSLLYEVLHTKLPVVGCKIGYVFRFITMCCILGALLSFSLFKKHYELGQFDIWLTYGLLIGALLLEFISIILLRFSDWILATYVQSMEPKFFNMQRWCKSVSQLNFITYYVKYSSVLLKGIPNHLGIRVSLEAIKGILCLSFQDFKEDQEWSFIYEEVKNWSMSLMADETQPTGLQANQAWKSIKKQALERFSNSTTIVNIFEELDYSKSVLTWHIATEICWLQQEQDHPPGSGTKEDQTSTSNRFNHREICKLLSNYMFYLLIMHPTMMAAVSVSWKIVFEDTLAEAESLVSRRSISSNGKDVKSQISEASKKILELIPNARNPQRDIDRSVLFAASALAKQLKKPYPWESMSKVWVQLMCFAAINCRPQVHAQQPSKGGELLTFVWLLMNHLGVGTHFSSH